MISCKKTLLLLPVVSIINFSCYASSHNIGPQTNNAVFKATIADKCGFNTHGSKWTSDMIKFSDTKLDKSKFISITPYSNKANANLTYTVSVTSTTLKFANGRASLPINQISIKDKDDRDVLSSSNTIDNFTAIELYAEVGNSSSEFVAGEAQITATVTLSCGSSGS